MSAEQEQVIKPPRNIKGGFRHIGVVLLVVCTIFVIGHDLRHLNAQDNGTTRVEIRETSVVKTNTKESAGHGVRFKNAKGEDVDAWVVEAQVDGPTVTIKIASDRFDPPITDAILRYESYINGEHKGKTISVEKE